MTSAHTSEREALVVAASWDPEHAVEQLLGEAVAIALALAVQILAPAVIVWAG